MFSRETGTRFATAKNRRHSQLRSAVRRADDSRPAVRATGCRPPTRWRSSGREPGPAQSALLPGRRSVVGSLLRAWPTTTFPSILTRLARISRRSSRLRTNCTTRRVCPHCAANYASRRSGPLRPGCGLDGRPNRPTPTSGGSGNRTRPGRPLSRRRAGHSKPDDLSCRTPSNSVELPSKTANLNRQPGRILWRHARPRAE